jgi:hypothetical protein
MNTSIGLREQIANATTENEIITLLASGQSLEYASSRTKQSWKHTAQRRFRDLQKANESNAVSVNIPKTNFKNKKSKKR